MANPILLTTIETVADFLGVNVLNPSGSDWMVLDYATNQIVITPDTVPSFDYRTDTRVSDFPLQQGAFASYNKVQLPSEIRMTLVCSGLNFFQAASAALNLNFGNNYMQKKDFLSVLEDFRKSEQLLTIVTPDATYTSFTLEHFDYRRETTRGANILYVECLFREIRQVTTSNSSVNGLPFVNSNSVGAANPINNGIVQTFPYGTNAANIGFFQ